MLEQRSPPGRGQASMQEGLIEGRHSNENKDMDVDSKCLMIFLQQPRFVKNQQILKSSVASSTCAK